MILFLQDFQTFLSIICWGKCVLMINKMAVENFAVWYASSACGVRSGHLNYTKHHMVSVSISHVLSHQTSPEKITGSAATRNRF